MAHRGYQLIIQGPNDTLKIGPDEVTSYHELRTAIMAIYCYMLRSFLELGAYHDPAFIDDHEDLKDLASDLITNGMGRYIETELLKNELALDDFGQSSLSLGEPTEDWAYSPYHLQSHPGLGHLQETYTGLYQFFAYTCYGQEYGNELTMSPGAVLDIGNALGVISQEAETLLGDDLLRGAIDLTRDFFVRAFDRKTSLKVSLS